MARRPRSGGARRPGRQKPPVPFLLAAARPAAARSRPDLRRMRSLARLAAAWEALRPLEEAAWRGALSARGLARLQRARVAYARLFEEAGP